MKKLTNTESIPLSLAIWLADDDYDYDDDPNTISATTLLKPLKAIVLGIQSKELDQFGDVNSLIPSRMGQALHTAIESSWQKQEKVRELMKMLGYPDDIVNHIKINPKPEDLDPADIPVYMEQRFKKKIGKYTISGKFDFCLNGALEDFKSTGVYNYISGSNKEKYLQQGSIYRWLAPDIITEPYMTIQYLFTDWSKLSAMRDKQYPQKRLMPQRLQLMSIEQTHSFIETIVRKVELLEGQPQEQLPACTPDELWKKPDVFKYFKNPAKLDRSTKNFDNMTDAQERLAADGHVGVIQTVPGEVVRCRYCNVVGVCDQAQQYLKAGLLTL